MYEVIGCRTSEMMTIWYPIAVPNGSTQFQNAQALQANRARSARDRVLAERASVGDSPVTEERKPSPIELPEKSYTDQSSGGAGMPSHTAEINKQRAKQIAMKQRAQDFVGAPVTAEVDTPTGRVAPAQQGQERGMREQTDSPLREPETESPEAATSSLDSKRAKQGLIQKQKQEQAAQAAALAAAVSGNAKEIMINTAWKRVRDSMAVGSLTLTTIPVLWAMMNIQVINTFSFKSPFIPKANVVDILLTLLVDLALAIMFVVLMYLFISLVSLVISAGNIVA